MLANMLLRANTTVLPFQNSPITLNNPNAYNTPRDDYFGFAVGISGDYCIVGAYMEDDVSGTSSGKAYIFRVSTGELLITLNNPNAYSTSSSDFFGRAVGISGDYCIVGAYGEDQASYTTSGKAYIFNVTTGALLFTLNDPNAYNTPKDDNFAFIVAISGDYCIIGTHYEDDSGGTSSGKAYIFNVTTGARVHTLNNPNVYGTSRDDYFGYAVGISGDYCIVGAYSEDEAAGTTSGKAYIFSVITGALVRTLDNPNAFGSPSGDAFGSSVGISGDYCIVGAYGEDELSLGVSGRAYIFNVNTGSLVQTLTNPNAYGTAANDQFGSSVGISGDYCIVGAYYEDDLSGINSGKAYIFKVPTGELFKTLDNPNAYDTSSNDLFGFSVAITEGSAIVGAYFEDMSGHTSVGKAYLFT